MPTQVVVSDIANQGGYTWPGTGSSGYLQVPTTIPHYQGPGIVSHIPEFQRDFNLRDALITRIKEGKSNVARILFDWARMNGAYSVNDVSPKWYLDHVPTARFYLKVKTNQGGTAGSQYSTGKMILGNVNDARRLQTGDLLAFMGAVVPPSRNSNSALVDYVESPAGSGAYVKKGLATAPLPEMWRVEDVNYTTAEIRVTRNIGGDLQTASKTGAAFTVVASGTTDPGANIIRQDEAFFIKMTKPMREGNDDATVWQRSPTWDFNHCQYILRKWGVTDIQQNVYKRGGDQNQYAKNKREALEQAFEELDYYLLYGIRKEDYDADGRWRGHSGGFFEHIASDHYVAIQGPNYQNFGMYPGDFTIPRINQIFHNRFYYGSQQKILACGNDFHMAFATMINYMTQNIPYITDRWSVRGLLFRPSNGGEVFVINSDTLTLNGMSHVAVLMDPSTFQYGHLENMDLTVVDPLPTTNIHEQSGEVFGVFTTKRTNPDANWVFVTQPNVQT